MLTERASHSRARVAVVSAGREPMVRWPRPGPSVLSGVGG